jgi:hypothetical protein
MISRKYILILAASTMLCVSLMACGGGAKSNDISYSEPYEPLTTDGKLASTVCKLNMRYADALDISDPALLNKYWDDLHAIATLQGVVNREEASLYIDYVYADGHDIDQYWWDKYSAAGEWLSGCETKELSSVVDAIDEYKDKINGVVLYDSNVASTSNVASAVAGIENLVAIRYDPTEGSLYSQVVSGGLNLPVKVRLVNEDGTSMFTGSGTIPETNLQSTGSVKCDPYYWFIENYIKTGKCDTRWGGYYVDQYWRKCPNNVVRSHSCLTNHDFFVSRKAFFFDLSPWGDEPATDDPAQPLGTDLKTLRDLLLAAYNSRSADKMCYIGGFPSWGHKYTDFGNVGGRHGGVPTEWEYSKIISQYNCLMDADAIAYGALANASFWHHFPLEDSYKQDWVTVDQLRARGFLDENGKVVTDKHHYCIFYVGDYDASSWIYQKAPTIWDDPARGSVPLMWCISPVLCERSPQVLHYFYATATDNDYFAAADNGAGYLNPGELQEPRASGLPSGIATWKKHCLKYYAKWDMTISGFIIDGNSKQMNSENLDAYSVFSPNGIVPQKTDEVIGIHNNMPIIRSGMDLDAGKTPSENAQTIVSQVTSEQDRPFHWFRAILAKPEWYQKVIEETNNKRSDIIFLDAPTYFELLRIYASQNE